MLEEFKKVSEGFSTASGRMQDRTKELATSARSVADQAASFGKGNLEAVLESGRIAAAGTSAIARTAVEDARKNAEMAATAVKAAIAERSFSALFNLPTSYACNGTDRVVAETSKYMQSWLKLAGEVAQPLVGRANAAVKMTRPTADA